MNGDHLKAALASLREEGKTLTDQISALQAKLEIVEQAIRPIEKLLGSERVNLGEMLISRLSNAPSVYVLPVNAFREMTLPDAIKKLLEAAKQPMTAPDIARQLLAHGFQTDSKDFTNLVGVTLRRLEQKQFGRNEENLWQLWE